jgi:hypothetical protein
MVKRLSCVAAAMAALSGGMSAYGQELGSVKSYGDNGRLFSGGSSAAYLLTRQTYATEDSSGAQGQLRIVKKYSGGGYEEFRKEYVARCRSYDSENYVVIHEIGADTKDMDSKPVKTPDKRPAAAARMAYNLYWAACSDVFNKFK